MSEAIERRETIQEIESAIEYKLKKLKIDSNLTQDISGAFSQAMGGCYIYLPKPSIYNAYINSKNISHAYNGNNTKELAREYDVTVGWINKLLRMEKEGIAPKFNWIKDLALIEPVIQEVLTKSGFDGRYTQDIIESLCSVFYGACFYFPLDSYYKANQTEKAIYKEFKNGRTAKELARKYSLSVLRIYQITQRGKKEQWDTHD